ncbi:MAG: RNA chaperone Hfq [Halanaerobiales bacterium]
MNKTNLNLQDKFLNQLRKENILTTIFLVNGYQIRGLIKSFDSFTILLEVEGKQQMVYKHAISTIVPTKDVQLFDSEQI